MNDSAIFQGLTRAWSVGTPPVAWPVAFWKNCFFDCPVEVASHIQRFAGRQMQDQVQLFSELSKEENMANAFTKEAAFLQQSALAWNSEMLEVAELVQSKLLASTQTVLPDTDAAPN
ncbi:hypothetical protein [Xanthobacter tagetidis]|uniref:Phasin domain-containing protein n=1 Tax=Xanthobacter tagetidis TaxID=60216 RepID=A0A3L7AEK5_9HYPH|nr:hypothetical protein [Xanthobacter tagetidis]MBB6305880.1 hypothetical protein [Xanthobacter tagetidis]RLP78404.1 hypothetical protein D9R14_11380 [Xanthobacter tagetidis]